MYVPMKEVNAKEGHEALSKRKTVTEISLPLTGGTFKMAVEPDFWRPLGMRGGLRL